MSGQVLVVEDDADSRELLASLLELSGHQVVTAADGQQALDLLTASLRPCMVLLDLMMPRMNGWELQARMAAEPELARIPVVIVSGVADLESDPAAAHARAALLKPVDPDRLLDVVGQVCGLA